MAGAGPLHPDAAKPLLPFTVVLPVYNEARGVTQTVARLRAVLDEASLVYELVAVDDGSTDGSGAILDAMPGLRVLRHARNRGYGAALKTGIRAATHPLLLVLDADGTYPPEMAPALVAGCADADMVVGARIGAHVTATPLRSFVKAIFRWYAQRITATTIPDLNSGMRAFRREVADDVMDLLPDGFSFTTTITVGALLGGFVVRFEAIDYLPRIGRSKLRPVRDTWKIGRQLWRLGRIRATAAARGSEHARRR